MRRTLNTQCAKLLTAVVVAAAALAVLGTAPPVAGADSGPTAAETAAVNWAKGFLTNTSYDGRCLAFVFDAYQLSSAGLNLRLWVSPQPSDWANTYPSDIWPSFTHGTTHVGADPSPPYGALVFFQASGPDHTTSHVAISIGGGNVYSTKYGANTGVHIQAVSTFAPELGWWLPDSVDPGPSGPPVSDVTAPSISCALPDGIWHLTNVTLECTASDPESGLANPGDAAFSLPTSAPVGSEDGNAATGSHEVCDNAGNCATAGPISGNKIDMKAPSVTCASPDGQWHGANVSLGCGASDGGSGLANAGDGSFPLSTSVPAGTENANASTDSRQVCDSVGNCSSAGPFSGNKVDLKAPEVAFLSPAGLGTTAKPVFQYPLSFALKFMTKDGGSGVAGWTLTRHVAGSIGSSCRTSWHVDRTITGSTGGAALTDSERLGLGRCYFWTLDSVDAVGNHSSQAVSEVLRTPKLARVT